MDNYKITFTGVWADSFANVKFSVPCDADAYSASVYADAIMFGLRSTLNINWSYDIELQTSVVTNNQTAQI